MQQPGWIKCLAAGTPLIAWASTSLILTAWCCQPPAGAAPPRRHQGRAALTFHQAGSFASAFGTFRPVDAWFSYGPPSTPASRQKDLSLGPASHDAQQSTDVHFGNVEEEIVVIGERQRRDFLLVKPDDELTGPRALDAFQPYISLPGATCTYKNLCYDLSQPALRATLPRLAKLLFGSAD